MQEKKISTDVVRVRLNVWTIIGLILLPFLLFMLYVVLFSECSVLIRKSGRRSQISPKFDNVKSYEPELEDSSSESAEDSAVSVNIYKELGLSDQDGPKELINKVQLKDNSDSLVKLPPITSVNSVENSSKHPLFYNILRIIIVPADPESSSESDDDDENLLSQEQQNKYQENSEEGDKLRSDETDQDWLDQFLRLTFSVPKQPSSRESLSSEDNKGTQNISKGDTGMVAKENLISSSGSISDKSQIEKTSLVESPATEKSSKESSSELLTFPSDIFPKNDKNIKIVGGKEDGAGAMPNMFYKFMDFSIPNTYICEKDGQNLTLLIGINSDAENFEQRQAIRETWAKAARMNGLSYAFIVGIGSSDEIDNKIKHESDRYQDLIQTDVLARHYYRDANPVMFLKWITIFCSHVKYVIKADDNVFLNVPQIYKFIIDHEIKDQAMYGDIYVNELPDRDPNSEDYVSSNFFPGETYPTFLGHAGYLFPAKFVRDLYTEAEEMPYFPQENVLITGILAEKLNISREDASQQFVEYSQVVHQIEKCEFLKYSIVHPVTAEQIRLLWDEIKSTDFKCNNFFENMLAMIQVDNGSKNIKDQQDTIYKLLNDEKLTPKIREYTSILE